VDKFESLDEAITHYTNQIQACSTFWLSYATFRKIGWQKA
jgi:hypothetical protein